MTTTRIGIDYTAAIQQQAGIGRYVRHITGALADVLAREPHAPEVRLLVQGLRPAVLPPPPEGFRYRRTPFSERTLARLWHRLGAPLPVETFAGHVALYHGMDFTLPPTLPRTRTVVTVYDLAYERYPDDTMPGMQQHLARLVPRAVAQADRVIAISQATRADLVALYGADPSRVAVIVPGVDSRFNPERQPGERRRIREKYGLPGGDFLLTVGTLQPRKNHARLVEAYARALDAAASEVPLVIAGARGWAYGAVHDAIGRLKLAGHVIFPGFVDDADLPALYRTALAVAYPSLYEGFGLPVAEAMACGTPVVTSNVSSLPEAAGDAALLVDPLDTGALADALARLLTDDALRDDLRTRGLAQAAQFTWQRAAEGLWGVYRGLLGDGESG